ncbi:aquaporin AQPAe.a-like [Tubulanus polymorphus]|uniref:aquaporin AQPAe.a-like n=1 Tax=Tubulanus polymorphus TaxID=672921 RepID=UPI003DA391B2
MTCDHSYLQLVAIETASTMETYFAQLAEQIENIRARKHAFRHLPMRTEVRTIEFWRSMVCECLGSFFYVFLTIACTLNWDDHYEVSVVFKALVHGVTLTTLVQCFGHISGGHLNPAVTVAMMSSFKISPLRGLFYMFAQIGGAIAGTALIYGLVPAVFRGDMGMADVRHYVTVSQTFGIEFLTAFIFVFTFFATVDPNRPTLGSQPLAIGIAMSMAYLTGCRYTDCLVNPVRALGPAFITNTWTSHWVFWVGPMMGGVVAGVMYEFIFDPSKRGRYARQVDEPLDKPLVDTIDSSPTHINGCPTTGTGLTGRRRSRTRSFNRPPKPHHDGTGHENRAYAYDTAPQFDYELDRLTGTSDSLQVPGSPASNESSINDQLDKLEHGGYEQPKSVQSTPEHKY